MSKFIPLPQTSRLSGKLFRLVRFIIPSARPEIPFASALAMIGYNVEKVLWEQAVVVPIGGDRDGKTLPLSHIDFFVSSA